MCGESLPFLLYQQYLGTPHLATQFPVLPVLTVSQVVTDAAVRPLKLRSSLEAKGKTEVRTCFFGYMRFCIMGQVDLIAP